MPGPYSRRAARQAGADAAERREFTLELASRLAVELLGLAEAGCPMAVVEEPDAVTIGEDDAERELFADAPAGLLRDAPALHAMLAITGGSAWEAGAETILGAPYQSYLFDLVAGPDNWHLVRAVPGDRGVVCGALRADSAADQAPELVWAARYAAVVERSRARARRPRERGLARRPDRRRLPARRRGPRPGRVPRDAAAGAGRRRGPRPADHRAALGPAEAPPPLAAT